MNRSDLLTELKAIIDASPLDADFCVLQTVYNILSDRTEDYEAWAREIGCHTCATCSRNSDNRDHTTACLIEEHYALPKDGYCHLWKAAP